MERNVLAILLMLIAQLCYGQGMKVNEEDQFAHQVKQIDELFERFNGLDNTLLNVYTQKKHATTPLSRVALMKTIFDSQRYPKWDLDEVQSFIHFVNNKTNPVYLNFYDDYWYAEAKCSVLYKGKAEKVFLILKVQQDNGNGLKWVIASAKAPFLNNPANNSIYDLPPAINYSSIISPVSHATEFMELDWILNDKKNIANHVLDGSKSTQLFSFITEIDKGHLKFEQVDTVIYHFLQIDGWTFTVKKFRRPMKNSGWLISSLHKMNNDQKRNYLATVLNIDR